MSRRREKRSFLALPVRISGTDANGNSFRHIVCTLDLSPKGARISSLQALQMRVGQELLLEHQRDRVRFRVVWAGEPGSNRHGQIGLQSLEPEKKFTAVHDQIDNRNYVDDWRAPQLRVEDDCERRSTQRFDCDRGVQYWTDQSATPFSGRLDNISLGGCYVATKFPLPRHSRVQLILYLYGMKIPAQGEVRTSDSQGMGIMFTALDKELELRIKKAVQRLAQTSQSSENRSSQTNSSDAHIMEEIRAWFDRNLTMTWEEFFDIQVRSKGNLVSASLDKEE
ncbi:MAG TPA: PilZ domain-containing protein [Terriglobales bacterium]|nr:PilZ domain-containing protein [Terriglobales bacterium]